MLNPTATNELRAQGRAVVESLDAFMRTFQQMMIEASRPAIVQPPTPPEQQWLTTQEVADHLKVSPDTVRRLTATNQLQHIRVGGGRGTLRVSRAALDAFIERRMNSGYPPDRRPPTREELLDV